MGGYGPSWDGLDRLLEAAEVDRVVALVHRPCDVPDKCPANIYAFMSQIMPYGDPALEMLYSFGKYLLPYLPLDRDTERVKLGDEIGLQSERALVALGIMLNDVMEDDSERAAPFKDKITAALSQNGLRYATGGTVVGYQLAPTVATIESQIRSRNWASLDKEYQRAFESIKTDPPQAVTAACAILESLCKIYIETEKLDLPGTQTLQNLWPVVQKALGLYPASKEDDDLKKILQGLASTAVGIAHLRTHTGSAHGRGLTSYRVEARHAHLAVGAAHALTNFLIETWDSRRGTTASLSVADPWE